MSIRTIGPLFEGSPKITPAIRKAAQSTLPYAKLKLRANTPVLTGRLREGWQVSLKDNGISIENDVSYAIYRDMGTKWMAGAHMVGRSLPDIQAEFKKQLAAQVGDQLAADIVGSPEGGDQYIGGTKDSSVYSKLTTGESYGSVTGRGFSKKGLLSSVSSAFSRIKR